MLPASGFQIAFLIFALEFLSMLAASYVSTAIGLPARRLELVGQTMSSLLIVLVLLAVQPLRRYCERELSRAMPCGSFKELACVSLGQATIPFALVGLSVAWAFAMGIPEQITSRIRLGDPAEHWAWTLSPPGLFRMLVLSWLVGPVTEELLFRGFLYRAWEAQWGWVPSMVLTSVCFGLAHPANMVATGLGSVVLICVLRRFGTLRACIVVHILFNVIISWPFLGHVLFTAPEADPTRLSTWTLQLACLALVSAALPAYVWLSRKDARAPDFR
jgi:membrane protease YdiL (CAAX protease family)